jgi:hypothetical protein
VNLTEQHDWLALYHIVPALSPHDQVFLKSWGCLLQDPAVTSLPPAADMDRAPWNWRSEAAAPSICPVVEVQSIPGGGDAAAAKAKMRWWRRRCGGGGEDAVVAEMPPPLLHKEPALALSTAPRLVLAAGRSGATRWRGRRRSIRGGTGTNYLGDEGGMRFCC